jgi:hypothetical protein
MPGAIREPPSAAYLPAAARGRGRQHVGGHAVTVTCPSCQATYRLPEGTRAGAKVLCKRCGTRFRVEGPAPPPVERHPRPHHAEVRRARRSNSSALAFGMIIAVVAVGLVAILVLANRRESPSLAQLKKRLGVPAGVTKIELEIDDSEFLRRLGSYDDHVVEGHHVFFYCTVQEGEAEIVLDRGAWEIGRPRIEAIRLRAR